MKYIPLQLNEKMPFAFIDTFTGWMLNVCLPCSALLFLSVCVLVRTLRAKTSVTWLVCVYKHYMANKMDSDSCVYRVCVCVCVCVSWVHQRLFNLCVVSTTVSSRLSFGLRLPALAPLHPAAVQPSDSCYYSSAFISYWLFIRYWWNVNPCVVSVFSDV